MSKRNATRLSRITTRTANSTRPSSKRSSQPPWPKSASANPNAVRKNPSAAPTKSATPIVRNSQLQHNICKGENPSQILSHPPSKVCGGVFCQIYAVSFGLTRKGPYPCFLRSPSRFIRPPTNNHSTHNTPTIMPTHGKAQPIRV